MIRREKLLIKSKIEFSAVFNKSFLTTLVFLLSLCYGFLLQKILRFNVEHIHGLHTFVRFAILEHNLMNNNFELL